MAIDAQTTPLFCPISNDYSNIIFLKAFSQYIWSMYSQPSINNFFVPNKTLFISNKIFFIKTSTPWNLWGLPDPLYYNCRLEVYNFLEFQELLRVLSKFSALAFTVGKLSPGHFDPRSCILHMAHDYFEIPRNQADSRKMCGTRSND